MPPQVHFKRRRPGPVSEVDDSRRALLLCPVSDEIAGSRNQTLRVVLELTQPEIAPRAEKSAQFASLVIVIGVRWPVGSTDGANPALRLEQSISLRNGDPEGAHEMARFTMLLPTVLAIGGVAIPSRRIPMPIRERRH